MVIITSIFVAEIEVRPGRNGTGPVEWDLSVEERRSALEEMGRELIGMYEGKNRVEPIE
jgi:hypothetical protein